MELQLKKQKVHDILNKRNKRTHHNLFDLVMNYFIVVYQLVEQLRDYGILFIKIFNNIREKEKLRFSGIKNCILELQKLFDSKFGAGKFFTESMELVKMINIQ